MNTTKYILTPILLLALFFSCHLAVKAAPGDGILGFWEVKNDYYTAIYEIVKQDNQYFGKVHYYNDGDTIVKAQKSNDDFMLEGIFCKDSTYTDGILYDIQKKKHRVSLLLDGDTITLKMVVEGYPYTEYWTRQK